MNDIKTWQQGKFIDGPEHKNMTQFWKDNCEASEKFNVRPSPKENAICVCNYPDDAKWIAQRLNLASVLEQMTYDFATGKTDGSNIIELVRKNIG